jgi:hypothetical protein
VSYDPPSVRHRPGDPKPIGFQDHPSAEHIDRTSDAIADLVRAVNDAKPKAEGLNEQAVRICNVRFAPGSPFELYGFHINEFGPDEEFLDPRRDGGEIRFAVVVNHTTEVQIEVVLGFLFELVERGKVVEAAQRSGDVTRIDLDAQEGDKRAGEELTDRMRFGWREAAKRVAQLAAEEGLRLRLSYQRDVFTRREELVNRAPALRRVYNELDSVRRAVDNMVSMVGGSYPHLRYPGAPAQAREFAQAQLAIFGLRQFQNQTMRDAEVCGNGYMAFADGAEVAPRCLRPENVLITDSGSFAEVGPDGPLPLEGVIHLRGLEQIDSPYGMSVLEPHVFALNEARIARESRRLSEIALGRENLPEEFLLEAPKMIEQADRWEAAIEDRLTRILGFTRDSLPPAKSELYFPDQKDMR